MNGFSFLGSEGVPMKKIFCVFISIVIIDLCLLTSCKNKSSNLESINGVTPGMVCSEFKEHISKILENPGTTTTIEHIANIKEEMLDLNTFNPASFLQELFNSSKAKFISELQVANAEYSCQIQAKTTGTFGENCSDTDRFAGFTVATLQNLKNMNDLRIRALNACDIDNNLMRKATEDKEFTYMILMAILANSSDDFNQMLANTFFQLNITKSDGASDEEIRILKHIQTLLAIPFDKNTGILKNNNAIIKAMDDYNQTYGEPTSGNQGTENLGGVVQTLKGFCKALEKVSKNARSVKGATKSMGGLASVCANCSSTASGACKAVFEDLDLVASQTTTKNMMKSSAMNYVKPFIKQVGASVFICLLTSKWLIKKVATVFSNYFLPTISKFWPKLAEKLATVKALEKNPKLGNIWQAVVSAGCELTFNLQGDAISQDMSIDYDDCGEISEDRKQFLKNSHNASCFRTAASLCTPLFNPGYVDFDIILNSFGVDTENEGVLLATLSTAGTIGLTKICQTGRWATAFSCSFMAAALAQYNMAQTQGTSDWAHCLRLDSAGVCKALKWTGKKLGTTYEYIKSPIKHLNKNKKGQWSGQLCKCTRKCFYDASPNIPLYGETPFGNDEIAFFRLGEDLNHEENTKACLARNGKKTKYPEAGRSHSDEYGVYSNCSLVDVTFLNEDVPESSFPIDGTTVEYRLLDNKDKAGITTARTFKDCVY